MSNLMDLIIDPTTLRVKNRECEHREFKEDFEENNLWKYGKTVASFANRDGGVIVFGIKNSPRQLIGIKQDFPEDLILAHFLKEYFQPEISFYLGEKIIHKKQLVFVLVEQAKNKPVICKKKKISKAREKGKSDKELLREGAIYYRYSSSSEEIKYPELKTILDGQVQKVFHSLVDNITLMNKVGYDRAAIVDASQMSGKDKVASIFLTSETAKNLNWIAKGKFAEKEEDGEKAFYVTRQVEIKHGVEIGIPVDPGKTHQLTKTALTKAVSISSNYIDAILWKLGILDNPVYHFSGNHGKNRWHKYKRETIEKVLEHFPITMEKRLENICITNLLSEHFWRTV